MERKIARQPRSEPGPEPSAYEPPCVERVLTPEELEREVLYAGDEPSPGASA